jgi:hypothetical protein
LDWAQFGSGQFFGKQWLRLVGLSVTEEDKKNALFMFAKRSMKLFFIEGIYHVFCITVVALILTMWH